MLTEAEREDLQLQALQDQVKTVLHERYADLDRLAHHGPDGSDYDRCLAKMFCSILVGFILDGTI